MDCDKVEQSATDLNVIPVPWINLMPLGVSQSLVVLLPSDRSWLVSYDHPEQMMPTDRNGNN